MPAGGPYVASLAPANAGLLKAVKLRRLRRLATQFAVQASQLRLSAEDLHKLLDSALQGLRRTRKSTDDPEGNQ